MALTYYRLLAGDHIGNDEEGKERYYRTGELVPSSSDLEARWPEKFRRVDAPAPAVLEAAKRGFGTPTEGKSAEALRNLPAAAPTNSGTLIDKGESFSPPQAGATKSAKAKAEESYTDEELAVFDTYTVHELKAYAEEEHISLKGATHKQDMVDAIKANLRERGKG